MATPEELNVLHGPLNKDNPDVIALDELLKDVIQGTYAACIAAGHHLEGTDLEVFDRAMEDCRVNLDLVMDGQVEEWIR